MNEETSQREENIKHFRLSDGSYSAVVYDEPVHYRQEGEWIEIDNTLVPATLLGEPLTGTIKRNTELTAEESQAVQNAQGLDNLSYIGYFENKDNDFKVQLPKGINNNIPVVVRYGGYTVRFRMENIADAAAQVTQPLDAAESAQRLQQKLRGVTDPAARAHLQKEHAVTVQKNRSAVSYASVQSNMNLHYSICGQSLKEDIVLNALPAARTFSFLFTYTGLQAVLEDDKSVTFRNEEGKPVFRIAAPFMYDAGEGYSTDIAVHLEQTDTGCRYTLTPDRAWLEDEARIYPVTLDPSLEKTTQNAKYVLDAGVQESDPTLNYYKYNRIYVGSGPSSTEGRMYFDLSQWPSASGLNANTITSAQLYLNYYPTASYQTGNNMYIDTYRVASHWDSQNITWNGQPGVTGGRISAKYIGDNRGKTSGSDAIDVTAWVKARYSSPSTNHGIRLQPRTVAGSLNRVCYISSDYTANTSLRPIIHIYYNAYTLYLKQFYDAGYTARYGGTPSSTIAAYTKIVSDYYLKVFGIQIHSTVSTYSSPADTCTHKSSYNAFCSRTLTGTCDYYSNRCHCTNTANLLFTKPSGISTIPQNTFVLKWTGHLSCEYCAVGGHNLNAGAVSGGPQILVHWGNRLTTAAREKTSVGSIAHELGHSLGCIGDDSNSCKNSVCIMKSHVSDDTKLANLKSFNPEAYCQTCRGKIQSYANAYLT